MGEVNLCSSGIPLISGLCPSKTIIKSEFRSPLLNASRTLSWDVNTFAGAVITSFSSLSADTLISPSAISPPINLIPPFDLNGLLTLEILFVFLFSL